MVKGNIGSFMKQLREDRFVRIYRSSAIALSYVQSFNQSEVHLPGHRLAIGGSYRASFLNGVGEGT